MWDREPLVPVTVTVKVPAVLELHERVAVPETGIAPGLIALQLKPMGNEVSESDTVPVNPTMLAMLTVTVPLVPAARLRDDGFTPRVKS